ncbi:MAG: metal ABC transporter permease [Firmicutes bacterium]|nr:metal ABC transporter permease [Bacillota bacterium]
MIEAFLEMLSYPFLLRALIVGVLISLCAAVLGVTLVLKRYSMIGDGLSHVGFGAMAIAAALNIAPLSVALPAVIVAAFLLLRLSGKGKIRGDAATALISSGALAVGVMSVSLTTGMNVDIYNYMFGSILSLSAGDAKLSIIVSALVLILFVLMYPKIFALTFDENFAKATGVKTGLYDMLIAFFTAITIVLGMRMMGALLISSLIIFPSLTSMRICKSFKSVTIVSALISVICFIIGMLVSYTAGTPTGASIVCVNIVLFFVFWAAAGIKNSVVKHK